jgi:hypothetical protein
MIAITEAKTVLDRKAALTSNVEMVQASLQTLVYCASILNEPLLFQLQEELRACSHDFKFPSDEDIRHELVRYHKRTQDVTFEMQNLYILDYCGKYELEMAKVCAVGHKYGYGASRQT